MFSDASADAYGSCVYLRTVNEPGSVTVKFVASKAKVVPINCTATIPRLELMGEVCGVTLEERVRKALIMRLELSCFWIDSTIVLSWISNDAKQLETFVMNRVRRIRESVDPGQFKHVSGVENPADLVSRGGTVSEVEMWHLGPVFLLDPGLETAFEKRDICCNIAVVFEGVLDSLIERVSSYPRLCRIVALVFAMETSWCF